MTRRSSRLRARSCAAPSASTEAASAESPSSPTPTAAPPVAAVAPLPPVKASFLTFNMCGSAHQETCDGDSLPHIVDFVVQHKPTAFALQEVCGYQADRLSRELRARGLDYVQRYRNLSPYGLAPFCGLKHQTQGEGIALFHAGTTLGEVREGNFATLAPWQRRCRWVYPPVANPRPVRVCVDIGEQPRGYVCANVPQAQLWACATHIEVWRPSEATGTSSGSRSTRSRRTSQPADARRPGWWSGAPRDPVCRFATLDSRRLFPAGVAGGAPRKIVGLFRFASGTGTL